MAKKGLSVREVTLFGVLAALTFGAKVAMSYLPNIEPVTLFLMNGFQLRGTITGFDSFVVVLVTDGKQQMIYKHAISTIVPERPLSWEEENSD